jgi:sulfite reductase (NADPH) hemoprotein beta-component
MATAARVLVEFVPAAEMLEIAEAIVRVFHALGDYEHKARNRMKFLIKSLGWDRWRELFLQHLEIVRTEGIARLPFDPERPPVETAPEWPQPEPPSIDAIATRVLAARLHGPGIHPAPAVRVRGEAAFRAWSKTNVRPQKQPGFMTAVVSVPLGDLIAVQLRVIRDLAASFSDGTVRVSATQNLLIRWVAADRLPALYDRLAAAGLGLAGADTIEDVTSCPGAESCRLAVTQSRGLGRTLESHVRAHSDLARVAPTLDVKISGCPNGCGQHHVAAIGFQGSLRKLAGRAVPQYFVFVGGGGPAEATAFGRLAAKVPARRAAAALERLARFFADHRQNGETASSFFRRIDPAQVKALLADLESLTLDTASAEDFVDLGDTHTFAPETLEGECSA